VSIFFLISCAPCRQVKIDSYPPGAAISILSSSRIDSRGIPPLESWSLLGHTPLTVSGCRLNDEIKAGWDGRELFFPDYHGTERILFNFEEEEVKEE